MSVRTALRKHNLTADFHIHSCEDPSTEQEVDARFQRPHLKSVCSSAIMKGLDLIGIVSRINYDPGIMCKQIIAESGYDLVCLAGVEVETQEGLNLVVYDARSIPQNGISFQDVCRQAHQEGGVTMAIQPNRRNMQKMNSIVGTPDAPDFIEIFNDVTKGGYSNAFVDFEPDPEFQLLMNSAARNASEIDNSVMMTSIPRKTLIELGIVSEETGTNYIPPYLKGVVGDGPVGGVGGRWHTAQ